MYLKVAEVVLLNDFQQLISNNYLLSLVCVVVDLCTYHICWVNEGIQTQYFGESHSVCVCVVCVCVCVYVCMCLGSLPVKEGGRERVHCTLSQ